MLMHSNVIIISVVRDYQMYDTCVRSNPFANCYTVCPLDNTRENKTVPVRYNEFLNSYDFSNPAWLVFCHEDFELKQAVDPLLEPLDTNVLYGPIGARTDVRWFDENLSFDLYIEDFCISAKENHGVPSQVLAVECQHWSGGAVRERYYHQEAYLNKKYPHCCYTGTSSYSIGEPGFARKLNEAMKRSIRRFLSAHG